MFEKILNIAESSEQLSLLDKGLILLNVNQLESHSNFIWDELTQEYIQFHFGLKGTSKVHFNQKNYTIDLKEEQSLLIYNPNQKLPLDMEVEKGSSVISVFNFLFDYKMDYSRKLLDSGKYNINEVGEKVGYSTASHFIASFKKKYGITPKKYVQSQTSLRS